MRHFRGQSEDKRFNGFHVFDRQLLAKIYKMPSKPVFLGARLASLPTRTQERSISTEDGMDCVLQEFDDDTGDEVVPYRPFGPPRSA